MDVNLTTRKLCYATDYCGVKSGRNTDKFADMHLTPQQSVKIAAPAIKESPVNIECKVKDIIELGKPRYVYSGSCSCKCR